jgi:hypothetical protein
VAESDDRERRRRHRHRYGTRDDRGQPMETLKIISSPSGGYLGVYHTIAGERAAVRVATSTDLLQ